LATSSSQRRSYSSWLPSHQWTAPGWKSWRPFSTKSNRAWFVVAAVISKFFPTRGPRSRTGAGGSGQSFQLGLGADGDEYPVGAGLGQLGLRALDPGPGDDEQVGAQRPGGEGHEQVGGVGVEGADQHPGPLDARLPQDLVGGGVAPHDKDRALGGGRPVGIL